MILIGEGSAGIGSGASGVSLGRQVSAACDRALAPRGYKGVVRRRMARQGSMKMGTSFAAPL